jgi:hypothetical protein
MDSLPLVQWAASCSSVSSRSCWDRGCGFSTVQKRRFCRTGVLGRGSSQLCRHGHPVESHIAPEPQAWNRIPAAPTGLFVDPGFGHLQPGCKFLGRDDVFG